jgi:hypothetical protein
MTEMEIENHRTAGLWKDNEFAKIAMRIYRHRELQDDRDETTLALLAIALELNQLNDTMANIGLELSSLK